MPLVVLAAAGGALLAGCGGGARQDASEPSGVFHVAIVRASFPAHQSLASEHHLVLSIRNTGHKTVPDLAVTVDNLSFTLNQSGLANNQRPVWIVDDGPGPAPSHPLEGDAPDTQGGYVTAYTNTWAAGPVPAGRTVRFVWKLTAVKAGVYTIHYRVAAGLNGKARARLAGGRIPQGSFTVSVAGGAPAPVHVDPSTGRVVPGPPPLASQ